MHVPSAPGVHDLSCRVWRPRGSLLDRFATFFVGGAPALKDPGLRFGFQEQLPPAALGEPRVGTRLMRAKGSQTRFSSAPCGEVHLRLSVCRRAGMSSQNAGGEVG